MKKGQVRDLIFNALAPIVLVKGFRQKKREGHFFRLIPGGNQTIGVPLVDYNPEFKFSLHVTVRLDRVEDIKNLFNEAPPEYRAGTTTFVGRLERFMAHENSMTNDFRFRVFTEENVKAALSCLLPVVQNRILPFLDEHQDVQTIAKAMNLTVFPKFVSSASEAFSPVVVAHLSGSPDFNAIVAGYRKCMNDLPESSRQKFQKLITHLEKL